jgi:hypothetical protein
MVMGGTHSLDLQPIAARALIPTRAHKGRGNMNKRLICRNLRGPLFPVREASKALE